MDTKELKASKTSLKERLLSIKKEDYFKFANLHCHSKFSDGKEDFDTLVETALKLGLKHFSICDHNTVEGYKHSKYKDNPVLIKGVEFDCFYQTSLLHILGYGIDIENPYITKLCTKKKSETEFDIVRLFHSRHPKDVIEGIKKAGGIAVFAHPCCSSVINLDYFIKKLVSFGLDGIETYYPYNRHRGIIKFSSRKVPFKLAQKYNLIQTGGTDEHGTLEVHDFSM